MKRFYIIGYYGAKGFTTKKDAIDYCIKNGISTKEIVKL